MAWGRVLNIYAGKAIDGTCSDTSVDVLSGSTEGIITGGGNFIRLAGDDPSTGRLGLDARAEIKRSNRMAKNTATVRVHGLNEKVRAYLENDGLLLRIDAGYHDSGFGTVFFGAFGGAQSVLEGADWVTEIHAYHFRAKGMSFETLFVALSYAPGASAKQVLNDFQSILGVPVYGSSAVSDVKLPNGWTYTGTMGGALRYMQSVLRWPWGFGIFYDLGELIVYKVSGLADAKKRFETVFLDKDHGLLSAKKVIAGVKENRQEVKSEKRITALNSKISKTRSADGKTRLDQSLVMAQLRNDEVKRKRVEFTCLANHRLRPSCPVQIEHEAVNGTYIVDDIHMDLCNHADRFSFRALASREE